ncbi:putative glycosylphosphatidylinositol-specific phospholipase C [Trypanosoma cruzi]|uniref:Putative glycosylphosphatidylinositol-specific phospholipase C n=1 Tax=Trypanosoma cruzi TaxID=5693 RepID=A0A2V2VST6_TRYCR|nr:putative glycosylphosphatidylinositol-specific phospholipase C [Trypanosoma cruzi]
MLPESDDFTSTAWHPQSWMHDLRSFIGEMAITQLCLLGSHNAASYGISKDLPFVADAPGFLLGDSVFASLSRFLFRGICASWAKCQWMSVRAQLDYGVRYLDLRVATNPEDASRLYTLHAQISVPLADVLEDVKAFLNDPLSADEFIVLDFQHLYLTDDSDGKGKFFGELDAFQIALYSSMCRSQRRWKFCGGPRPGVASSLWWAVERMSHHTPRRGFALNVWYLDG